MNEKRIQELEAEKAKLLQSLKELRQSAITLFQSTNFDQEAVDTAWYELSIKVSIITVRHGVSMGIADDELAPYRRVYGRLDED